MQLHIISSKPISDHCLPDAHFKAAQMKIVTVHGTNAAAEQDAGDAWWQVGSDFAQHLARSIPSAVQIEPFHWSGHNSEQRRRDASVYLFDKLQSIKEPFHLIGHSHGGSVILEALRTAQIERDPLPNLKSWICVGTPFIRYNKNRFLINRLSFAWQLSLIAQTIILLSVVAHFLTFAALSCAWSQYKECASQVTRSLTISQAAGQFGRTTDQIRAELTDNKYRPEVAKVLFGEMPVRPIWTDVKNDRWFVNYVYGILGSPSSFEIAGIESFGGWLASVWVAYIVMAGFVTLSLVLSLLYTQHYFRKVYAPRFAIQLESTFGTRFVCFTDGHDEACNALRVTQASTFDVVDKTAYLAPINVIAVLVSLTGAVWLIWLVFKQTVADFISRPNFFSLASSTVVDTAYEFFKLSSIGAVVFSAVVYGGIVLIGRFAISPPLARFSNRRIADAFRRRAFGSDVLGEHTNGVSLVPCGFTATFNYLPQHLSARLMEATRPHATAFVEKVRLRLSETQHDKLLSDVIDGITGRELVHNSYFSLPEVVKLIAFALCIKEGLPEAGVLEGDPDRTSVREWFSHVCAKTATPGQRQA